MSSNHLELEPVRLRTYLWAFCCKLGLGFYLWFESFYGLVRLGL